MRTPPRRVESQLAQITTRRNAIGAEMISVLDNAAFDNRAISPHAGKLLESEGRALIARAQHLASTA